MIAAGLIALSLAGAPAMLPASERRVVYYVRRKRRAGVVAPVTTAAPHAIVVEEPAQKRMRVIPIVTFDEFYRRVGL